MGPARGQNKNPFRLVSPVARGTRACKPPFEKQTSLGRNGKTGVGETSLLTSADLNRASKGMARGAGGFCFCPVEPGMGIPNAIGTVQYLPVFAICSIFAPGHGP